MAIITAAQAVQSFIDDVTSWVGRPIVIQTAHQSIENLISVVGALTPYSSEAEFHKVMDSFRELKSKPNLFQAHQPAQFFIAKAFVAALCAIELTNGNVSPTEPIRAFEIKAIEFEVADVGLHAVGGSTSPAEAFCYINFKEVDVIDFQKHFSNVPTEFYFRFVAAKSNKRLKSSRVLFVDADVKNSSSRVGAFLKLSLIRDGLHFHSRKIYGGSSSVRNIVFVNPMRSIEQFDDVLHVLSEANSSDGILERFLRSYQVLENFMVRQKIVSMQSAGISSVLTVRSLKNLYSKFEEKEQTVLRELIQNAFESITSPIGTNTIRKHIENRCTAFFGAAINVADIESDLFRIYGALPNKSTSFDSIEFLKRLASRPDESSIALATMIYSFRNAIVHNKEHEFHLTYLTLTERLHGILNDILIPAMEDLIFSLILVDTNLVWYKASNISLYAE